MDEEPKIPDFRNIDDILDDVERSLGIGPDVIKQEPVEKKLKEDYFWDNIFFDGEYIELFLNSDDSKSYYSNGIDMENLLITELMKRHPQQRQVTFMGVKHYASDKTSFRFEASGEILAHKGKSSEDLMKEIINDFEEGK